MASTGKRPKRVRCARKPTKRVRRSRAKPKPKRVKRKAAPKRKRAKTVPAPAPARTRTPTRKKKKGKPIKKKRSAKKSKTEAAIKRLRAQRAKREAREGLRRGTGDVEVIDVTGDDVSPDYRAYPIPDDAPDEVRWAEVPADQYREAMDWLEDIFGKSDDHLAADADEIEWFPTFDEVYDYIDALVEEYDLDAHELFELAFGYSDEAAA